MAGKGQGTIREGAGRRNQGGEDRGRRTEQEYPGGDPEPSQKGGPRRSRGREVTWWRFG